jgi:hypothetical protein
MRTNYRVYTETHTGEWKGQMAEYGDKFKELAATPGNKQEHAKVLAETLQNLRADTAIVGLKLIPMVDPETREIAPLDMVARKLTGRMNLEGSFGEDPVAAGYYTMVRKGFLFREARIVPMPNGSYVSIEQATRLPSSIRATATEFAEICRRIDSALEEGDPVAFASATIALSRSVSAFTTGDDQLAKKLGL